MTVPHDLWRAGCCVRSAAVDLLTEAGLRVPERGAVTSKGGDWECCEGLWVWLDTSTIDLAGVGTDGGCTDVVDRVYVVELGYPVCTEAVVACSPVDDGCGGEPCPDPPAPILGAENGCQDGRRPTVGQETAAIWAARYVLETDLPDRAKCCLRDCAGLRCRTARFDTAETDTEGACSITTVRLTLSW